MQSQMFVGAIFLASASVANASNSAVDLTADEPREIANLPCPPGVDDRSSELCAQWKAADAALVSANGTRSAAAAAWAASAMALATLLTGIAAAAFAWKAYRSASSLGRQELRPYLITGDPFLKHEGFCDGGKECWTIRFPFSNEGRTPATIVCFGVGIAETDLQLEGNASPTVEMSDPQSWSIVKPGDRIERVSGMFLPDCGSAFTYVARFQIEYRGLTDPPEVRYVTECQRFVVFMPHVDDAGEVIASPEPLRGFIAANDAYDRLT